MSKIELLEINGSKSLIWFRWIVVLVFTLIFLDALRMFWKTLFAPGPCTDLGCQLHYMVLYLNLATGFSAGIFGILKQRMWVRTFFSGWVSGTALVWLADAMQVLANEIASTSVVLIFLIVFAASIIVIVLNSYAYIRSKPIIPPPRMFSELS